MLRLALVKPKTDRKKELPQAAPFAYHALIIEVIA